MRLNLLIIQLVYFPGNISKTLIKLRRKETSNIQKRLAETPNFRISASLVLYVGS